MSAGDLKVVVAGGKSMFECDRTRRLVETRQESTGRRVKTEAYES